MDIWAHLCGIDVLCSGIGEGLAEYYYKNCASCEVIVLISRSRDKLELVRTRLDSNPQKKVVVCPCDVTDSKAMQAVLADIHRTYGQVDVLFANAGVSYRQLSLAHSFDRAVRDAFDINVTGVVNTVMPLIALKAVRQIAIVSSQAAYAPIVSPIYGATKQCVLSLGLDLRRMLARDHVAVSVISPGPVHTPMLVGSHGNSVARGVSTEEAARIIFDGLRRNQAEIVFPASTGIFMYALSFLPSCIAEPIVAYVLRR